ncbi:MAG: TonB-dependent receptor [Caulobacteraceae bacterium]|nr:TonB-dependent receptor [Caulobacteraceae bacterium]
MAAPHLASAAETSAATSAADPNATVSEVVVTADKAGLLERKPSTTVLGLSKPLLDTARSATLISDTTIERYGIKTIDDLVAIAPGTFTASFYGVPGSLNIRGTYGENYYQGFKLIENLGTYTTPIGDAARIDVVRGPPSPIYGPGKVGGFLNFVPKTAKESGAYLDHPTGEIDVSAGAYNYYDVNGQYGTPLKLGKLEGGFYAYAEYEHGDQYYYGIKPEHEMGQFSVNFDLPNKWSLETDLMLYHSDGDTQTPGWNRLTQNLIDNGTYITGRNTTLSASPGVGYLTPNQTVGYNGYPYIYTSVGAGLYAAYYGSPIATDSRFALDSGVGTTHLSSRQVYNSKFDFSHTFVPTIYTDLKREFDDGSNLNLQFFYNGLQNKRFVSYGYPAWFRSNVTELRVSYEDHLSAFDGHLTIDNIVGIGDRYSWSRDMQSYNSGVIALDRRDISRGASATDVICDPFTLGITGDSKPSNCLGWESDVHSTVNDVGVFFTSDIKLYERLDLTIGGRYDYYNVNSADTGILPYEKAGPLSAEKGKPTYTVSLSYKLPFGLMPYGTIAQTSALEYGQASDISTSLIQNGGWVRDSRLTEAGIKFQFLGGKLVGSADYYWQDRPQVNGQGGSISVVNTVAKGEELEIRWLATKNLSFTFAGDMQHTEVIGPDRSFAYIPAWAVCGKTEACELASYGGAFVVYDFSTLPGRAGNYALTTIPHSTASLYANYITDDHSWGKAGLTIGATHVTKTSGTIQGAVVYPAYYVANMSAFYKYGPYEVDLNIDNLFDKLYFTPDADTYVNLGALPSKGREWRLTLKRTF